MLEDPELGELIHNRFNAMKDLIKSTAVLSVKYLVLQMIRLEIGQNDETPFTFLLQQKGPGNPNFKQELSDSEFLEILKWAWTKLEENPDEFNPRAGAIVSQRLLQEIEDEFGILQFHLSRLCSQERY